MKKLISIFLVCIMWDAVYAQDNSAKSPRPDSVGYYMRDETNMAYSESTAKFVRLLIKTDSDMFRVNDYYMDGTQKLVAKTTVDSLDFLPGAKGICYEYYPNGKRKSIRNFDKGNLVGDATTYYANGGLHTIVNYSTQGLYLKQYLDSTGNVLTDNGSGRWVKTTESGLKGYMEGHVVNGKENGPWVRHLRDTTYTIVYKLGEAISGNEYLKVKDDLFKEAQIGPSFPGGDGGFNSYLSKNIRYPAIAREKNIQGKVVISFIVEKDGNLTDINIVQGIGGGCDQEASRVMSLSPKWSPGLINGKPVRVKYSVPISYALSTD